MNFIDDKTKIGIGSVQFGLPYGISNSTGQTSPGEVSSILKLASKNKIEIIDTASAYGNAEIVLGENDLKYFKIVSKFLSTAPTTKISNQLLKTLSSLKVTSIYAYLAHQPLELLDNLWQWEELGDFKNSGLIKKRGFSLNSPIELEMLLERGFVPDIVQVPYNYFDRRFEDLMCKLNKNGCEIHSRSAFLQGLFFRKAQTLPDFFNEVKPILSDFESLHFSIAGALLRFVTEKAFIDKVIIGVENINQLETNLIDLYQKGDLPDLQIAISNEILTPSCWPK